MPRVPEHCDVKLYADNTVLYCFSSCVNDLQEHLNLDLIRIANWLYCNKLSLNLDKTKCMLIGSSRKNSKSAHLSITVYTIK